MTEARPDASQMRKVVFRDMTAKAAQELGTAFAEIDPWARYAYTAPALTAYLGTHEADAPRFEIVVDDEIAGAICVRRNWLRGPYLQFLGILPAFQYRGTGGLALDWFEDQARATQAQNLWVAASDFNVRALAFYARRGFSRVARLEDLVVEDSAEILLRKRLTNA
jgi:GNAT superfamily N-acetyltransferase